MEKLQAFLEKYLMPVASKVSNNRYLQSIGRGFSILLPVTIMGAIFLLLQTLQIPVYQEFLKATKLNVILGFVPAITTNMLAVYLVFLIGKSFMEQNGYADDATAAGMFSLLVFFLMIPLGVSGVAAESKEVVNIAAALNTRFLGAPGLFTAIIVGLLVPTIYIFTLKRGWVIKLPDGVPPQISHAFSSLIPGFIIAILFSLVRYGFSMTSYANFNQFIYTFLQQPLTGLGASPLTFMLFILLVSAFWFFGIHGGQVVMPFLTAIYTPLALENLNALSTGAAMPHLITQSNWFVFASIGGGGGTLGLCIYLAFFAKSARFKSLGRLALPASLTGINEPITFGLPIVLNPILLIPFIVTPLTTFLISYGLTIAKIIPALNGTNIPTGTPVIFSAFITGGWSVAVLQVLLIALGFLIYYPFISILDKKAVEEEKKPV